MKILFVTLSNIGDCILTLPVLDALRQKYPDAQITCLVPARPQEIFFNNPAVSEVIIFDKHASLIVKLKLFWALSARGFDLVVDLRNSLFGVFLPVKKRSLFFGLLRRVPASIRHMRQKHLFWANLLEYRAQGAMNRSIRITSQDSEYIDGILAKHNLTDNAKLVVIAPGARSQVKCWDQENFSVLGRRLIQEGYRIILVGDAFDRAVCNYVAGACGQKALNLCQETSLGQLSALLKRSRLLITNDSALMHLASYLDLPVVAIFGPTNEEKYGPWSSQNAIVKKDIFCRPCEKAQCRFGNLRCLTSISPEDVLRQVKSLLEAKGGVLASKDPADKKTSCHFKRILITRTDRLGDVLLSTPVIKALRSEFPQSYIAMLVSPYTKEVLEGNPGLDEIIVFDKDGKDKSWWATFKFAKLLKKKKFNLAVVLHPTSRVHLLTFLAAIPKRLGYDYKLGSLLTDRAPHDKSQGQKHESEYALDLVRRLGISPVDKNLFMPIKPDSEKWVKDLFDRAQIQKDDKLLVIHPTASCPSRIWPPERFAQVADELTRKYGFKTVIVSGAKDMQKAEAVIKHMRFGALNLAGKTSISQLASLLKRSKLFISTDSGPMHVACALGVPVITIFGRAQAGLSPKRWGPLGEKSRILHKTVGCTECLAHNCQKGFACLKATTVEDVLLAAESILEDS